MGIRRILVVVPFLCVFVAQAQDNLCWEIAYIYAEDQLVAVNPSDGDSRSLLPDIDVDNFAISPDGQRIVYERLDNEGWRQFLYTGETTYSINPELNSHANWISWSSNNRHLTFVQTDEADHDTLYLVDSETGETQRLYSGEERPIVGYWSPDGTRFAYVLGYEGPPRLHIYYPEGAITEQIELPEIPSWITWSPQSTNIAFIPVAAQPDRTLHILNVASGEAREYNASHVTRIVGWLPYETGLVYLGRPFAGNTDDLYMIDFDTETMTRLTQFDSSIFVPEQMGFPLYFMLREPIPTLYVLEQPLVEPHTITTISTAVHHLETVTSDRHYLAYQDVFSHQDVVVINLQTGESQMLPESRWSFNFEWIPCR